MTIKRIGLLTSGGDAPGMNAAIRAVVLSAHRYDIEILGFYSGYNGLINDHSNKLSLHDVDGIIHRGGTILKSARCPELLKEIGIKQAAQTLMKNKVYALVVIGGDGSFNGLIQLSKHWQGQVIGIPGTIDNDVDGTDLTIGFSTAINTAIDAIDKIRDTADAFERIFVVELMGQHSGHITFNVGIACAAEKVLSFENVDSTNEAKTLKECAKEIKQAQKDRHGSYLIVIAENLWTGGVTEFAKQLKNEAGIDCTPCILGYIQRGGSPVAKDRILATKMGVAAVQAIIADKSNVMIGEQNNAIVFVPLTDAIKHKKQVSQSLVAAQENILALTAQTQC
ncbi:MAG: 6-phosphofructokinase [Colwellia sp.]|nr:6-phosphofructokinase [Colwellia sp.]